MAESGALVSCIAYFRLVCSSRISSPLIFNPVGRLGTRSATEGITMLMRDWGNRTTAVLAGHGAGGQPLHAVLIAQFTLGGLLLGDREPTPTDLF